MNDFLSTLLGAFLGVSLPFVIADMRARKAFENALDVVFAETDAYTQGLVARRNFLLQQADRSWDAFLSQLEGLLRTNIVDPTDCASLLVAQYAQYLRPADVYLLRQAHVNLSILVSGARAGKFKSRAQLEQMLSGLIEHAARRSFLVWNVASRFDGQFSQESYNELISKLNAVPDRRLRLVKSFRPAAP